MAFIVKAAIAGNTIRWSLTRCLTKSSKFASLWSSDLSHALKSLCCWGLVHYMAENQWYFAALE